MNEHRTVATPEALIADMGSRARAAAIIVAQAPTETKSAALRQAFGDRKIDKDKREAASIR